MRFSNFVLKFPLKHNFQIDGHFSIHFPPIIWFFHFCHLILITTLNGSNGRSRLYRSSAVTNYYRPISTPIQKKSNVTAVSSGIYTTYSLIHFYLLSLGFEENERTSLKLRGEKPKKKIHTVYIRIILQRRSFQPSLTLHQRIYLLYAAFFLYYYFNI